MLIWLADSATINHGFNTNDGFETYEHCTPEFEVISHEKSTLALRNEL